MSVVERAPVEDCDECGFGWARFSDEQAVGALQLTGAFLRGALAGIDVELANTRPASETWSILEYVDHIRHAMWIWRFVVEAAVQDLNLDLSDSGRADIELVPQHFDDVAATIATAENESSELFSVLRQLAPPQWYIETHVPLGLVDQRWVVRHALHEVLHHVHDVGRVRARLGDGAPHQVGSIGQISRSHGGVPKARIAEAEVGYDGIVGDLQNDRVHHGRPFQALCLFSTEVIDALVAEGHPIYAGAAGENLTIAGLDWSTLRPGAILSIGDSLLAEISCYATPCKKNAAWFAAGDFRRMHQDEHPGWSRLYATVLRPGHIRTGDPVIVEP